MTMDAARRYRAGLVLIAISWLVSGTGRAQIPATSAAETVAPTQARTPEELAISLRSLAEDGGLMNIAHVQAVMNIEVVSLGEQHGNPIPRAADAYVDSEEFQLVRPGPEMEPRSSFRLIRLHRANQQNWTAARLYFSIDTKKVCLTQEITEKSIGALADVPAHDMIGDSLSIPGKYPIFAHVNFDGPCISSLRMRHYPEGAK